MILNQVEDPVYIFLLKKKIFYYKMNDQKNLNIIDIKKQFKKIQQEIFIQKEKYKRLRRFLNLLNCLSFKIEKNINKKIVELELDKVDRKIDNLERKKSNLERIVNELENISRSRSSQTN